MGSLISVARHAGAEKRREGGTAQTRAYREHCRGEGVDLRAAYAERVANLFDALQTRISLRKSHKRRTRRPLVHLTHAAHKERVGRSFVRRLDLETKGRERSLDEGVAHPVTRVRNRLEHPLQRKAGLAKPVGETLLLIAKDAQRTRTRLFKSLRRPREGIETHHHLSLIHI